MKKYWTGVFGQVRAQQKRFVRDKMSLFFTFLFPLIFLLVFGSIFNNQSTSFDIAIINNSQTEFAKSFVKGAKDNAKDSILKIKDVKDMDEAELLCDRLAIMDSGKIITIDTPHNLIQQLLARGFKKEQVVEQANLEDVFIDLTGKAIRD